MIEKNILVGAAVITLNLIPFLINKRKLITLTSLISVLIMGLYLGGII